MLTFKFYINTVLIVQSTQLLTTTDACIVKYTTARIFNKQHLPVPGIYILVLRCDQMFQVL